MTFVLLKARASLVSRLRLTPTALPFRLAGPSAGGRAASDRSAHGGEQAGPADLLVAHHEHLQLFDVVDQELPEPRGQHVLCLLIAAVANVGHQDLALEPPANSVINTSRFTPVALKKRRKYLTVTK